MFEMKISFGSAEELVTQLDALRAALSGTILTPVPEVEEKPAGKKPKANGAAKQDTPPTSDPASTPESGTSTSGTGPTATTDASPSDGPITYEHVKKAVTNLSLKKGRDAVLGVFETFGVDHGSKLTEDQWPAALAALTEALDG